MKSLPKVLILLFLVTFFAACNNGGAEGDTETTTGEVSTTKYTMTALVDSVEWSAAKVETHEDQGTLYVTGTATDGSQLILELGEKPHIGIFPMRRGAMNAGTYVNKEGSKYYAPFSGTTGVINITEYAKDSILKAEFNFGATNSMDLHNVEGGVFTAPLYQNASGTVQ